MTAGAIWGVLRTPMLIGAVTGWSLIAALLSNGWLEWIALTLLSGVAGLVIAKLYRGVRRRSAGAAGADRGVAAGSD